MSDAAQWLDELWNREGVLLAFKDHREEVARMLALYAAEQTAALRAALEKFVYCDNGYCSACHGFWVDPSLWKTPRNEHRADCPAHLLADSEGPR